MVRQKHIIILMAALWLLIMSSCASLPKNYDRPASYALTDTDDTTYGKKFREEESAHPGKSASMLLGNGLDAFVARAVLADGADRSIDVQYYLFHGDLVGILFIDQLLKAADRGVRVRLLVDDMDMEDKDLGLAVLDSHPNMEVRIFNPFIRERGRTLQFITRLGSVTRRMHNKSFTVDNQATILGGRNIGNEYFEADPDLAFADLDVLCIGPVAKDVSYAFDRYWNSDLSYPATVLKGKPPTSEQIKEKRQELNRFVEQHGDSDYLNALRKSDLAHKIEQKKIVFHWGEAKVIYDEPEKIHYDFSKEEFHLGPEIAPYFDGVKEELVIFSPYFVPGREGVQFLTKLSQKGVRVRVFTNSLASTDVGMVHAGYAKHRKDLLRAGVELYEMNKKLTRKERKKKKGKYGSSKASLHAKSFVFDRKQVFIGSLNLDPRALEHNTEIGVILSSEKIANFMAEWFDNNINQIAFQLELVKNSCGKEFIFWHGIVDGQPQFFDVDPYTGFWRRFGIDFMSILPIESQL